MLDPLTMAAISMGNSDAGSSLMQSQQNEQKLEQQRQNQQAIAKLLQGMKAPGDIVGALSGMSPDISSAFLPKVMSQQPYQDANGNLVMGNEFNPPQGAVPLSAAKTKSDMDINAMYKNMLAEKSKADAALTKAKTDKLTRGGVDTTSLRPAEIKITKDIADDAESAQNALPLLQQGLDAIDNKGVTTGGTDQIGVLNSVHLMASPDARNLDSAMKYIQGIQGRMMNKGQGSVSNFERQLFKDASGIDWSKDTATVRAGLDRAIKRAKATIQKNSAWTNSIDAEGYAPTAPSQFNSKFESEFSGNTGSALPYDPSKLSDEELAAKIKALQGGQ